ncbi:MAG: hypothetical protein HUU60_11550 [Armatimonadetes bacterium]|nr:hypothetical protein [Armatimonadota bacterium]
MKLAPIGIALTAGAVIFAAVAGSAATHRLLDDACSGKPTAIKELAAREDAFDLLQSRPLSQRIAFAQGAQEANSPDAVKLALSMMKDPDLRVREAVQSALDHLAQTHIAPMAEGLKNPHANVRRAAIEALAKVGPPALPFAAQTASAAPEATGELFVKIGPASRNHLISLLKDPKTQNMAMDALGKLRLGAREIMQYEGAAAIRALAEIADPASADRLAKAAQNERESPALRATAIEGLGRIDPNHSTLKSLASHDDPAIAEAAVKTGATSKDSLLTARATRDETILVRLLSHPDDRVAAQAARSLAGRQPDALLKAVRSNRPVVIEAAIQSLDPDRVRTLTKDADPVVHYLARKAMGD